MDSKKRSRRSITCGRSNSIQVDRAVIQSIETSIEPHAEFNHRTRRMFCQEFLDQLIDHRGADAVIGLRYFLAMN